MLLLLSAHLETPFAAVPPVPQPGSHPLHPLVAVGVSPRPGGDSQRLRRNRSRGLELRAPAPGPAPGLQVPGARGPVPGPARRLRRARLARGRSGNRGAGRVRAAPSPGPPGCPPDPPALLGGGGAGRAGGAGPGRTNPSGVGGRAARRERGPVRCVICTEFRAGGSPGAGRGVCGARAKLAVRVPGGSSAPARPHRPCQCPEPLGGCGGSADGGAGRGAARTRCPGGPGAATRLWAAPPPPSWRL